MVNWPMIGSDAIQSDIVTLNPRSFCLRKLHTMVTQANCGPIGWETMTMTCVTTKGKP